MGIFAKRQKKSMGEYVAEAGEVGAVIVDVREPGEYAQGHVPGAVNIPLGRVAGAEAEALLPDKEALLYVHCVAGIRSARACAQLKRMGYENAVNIGGTDSYDGPLER